MRAALLAAALSLPAAASQPAGKALFDANGCRSCHAVSGIGANAAPDLTYVGFRHTARWLEVWLSGPAHWKRDTQMPDLRLGADERAALVEWLSSLKGEGYHPWTPGDGKAIYLKAGCVACHGARGRGGFPNNNVPGGAIPALTKLAETYTPQELRKKIAAGSVPQKDRLDGPEPLVFMPPWSKVLTDDEIKDVAAYVMSLSAKNPGAEW
jgi:mono/diheme cytochrome c family protein